MEKQFSVNVEKVKASLLKAGWTLTNDVYTSPAGCNVMFDTDLCRLSKDGVNQSVVLAKATDTSLVRCIKQLNQTGAILEHTDVEGLTLPAPAGAPLPGPTPTVSLRDAEKAAKAKEKADAKVLADANKAAKAKIAADEKAKKEADKAEKARIAAEEKAKKDAEAKKPPAHPVNPNADGSTPVFDLIAKAVEETETAEKTMVSIWQPIADKYGFSVNGLISDLHAEGRWPDRMNKDGVPFETDGFTVPAGYKSVYEAEKESGLQGAGHMVNRAARMLTKLNPNAKTRGVKPGAARKGTATESEKSVDQILLKMSQLAKRLSAADLQTWLETDPSVVPIIEAMSEQADLLSAL